MNPRVELLKSLERLRWLEIAKKPRKPARVEKAETFCFFCGDAIEGQARRGKDLTPACDRPECQELRAGIQRAKQAEKQRRRAKK